MRRAGQGEDEAAVRPTKAHGHGIGAPLKLPSLNVLLSAMGRHLTYEAFQDSLGGIDQDEIWVRIG